MYETKPAQEPKLESVHEAETRRVRMPHEWPEPSDEAPLQPPPPAPYCPEGYRMVYGVPRKVR